MPIKTWRMRTGCPVEATLEIIGGRWKGVILARLLERPYRFNEFRRLMPDTTQRVLTLQLRELERDGLVKRQVYAEIPPKVEYSLTELGESLRPIIGQMRDWGEHYLARQNMAAVQTIKLD